MKHLFAAVLACLLLAGCAPRPAAETTAATETTVPPTTQAAAPQGLYAAGSALEQRYGGAVRAYPLNISQVSGIRAMGDGVLVFSGGESTTLILLTGAELSIAAHTSLGFSLSPDDPSLRSHAEYLSYYDPVARQTVVLDASLEPVSHIAAPEDLMGTPILSDDRNTLYYCTSTAVRAWDLETGIRRQIMEMSYASQTLTGLHQDPAVLQCQVDDGGELRTLLLSAGTGQVLYQRAGEMTLRTWQGRYFAAYQTGAVDALLTGEAGAEPLAVKPGDVYAQWFYLDDRQALVTAGSPVSGQVTLDLCDLTTGARLSSLTMESAYAPTAVEDSADGYVYVLIYDGAYHCQTLYRWDPAAVAGDGGSMLGTFYTAENPDLEGLQRCREYALALTARYGVEILVGPDAAAVQPWDYTLEPEYLADVLWRELELLEQRLDQFPAGVLTDTAVHFTSLKVCLVRSLTGTAASGSLDSANGVQFLEGTDAYVAVAVGKYARQGLYHELFHVMQTHILTESIALDQWNQLNPEDFLYAYDYREPIKDEYLLYLNGEDRAFIDSYSMRFPKEDQARVFEYALLPGNAALFQSETLQAKLLAVCQGIREAYGLRRSTQSYAWEQYLQTSLAYVE